jgi:hypothetical protein
MEAISNSKGSGFRHSLFSGAKEAAPEKELKQWLNPSRGRKKIAVVSFYRQHQPKRQKDTPK